MSHGIYAALSGAVSQMTALDRTATNVANASTAGFREAHPVFHEVLGRATGGQALRFTAVVGTTIDTTPGVVRSTGREIDVALGPNDFLAVDTPRGERYTRAGSLRLAPDGTLRAAGGEGVLGENGRPIKVEPGASISIGADASVLANGAAAGHLRVVSFERPGSMICEGGTLLAPGAAGAPSLSKQPLQIGAVEESNASPIRGMTDLLQASRMFEAFERTIEAFHDADRKVLNSVPST